MHQIDLTRIDLNYAHFGYYLLRMLRCLNLNYKLFNFFNSISGLRFNSTFLLTQFHWQIKFILNANQKASQIVKYFYKVAAVMLTSFENMCKTIIW